MGKKRFGGWRHWFFWNLGRLGRRLLFAFSNLRCLIKRGDAGKEEGKCLMPGFRLASAQKGCTKKYQKYVRGKPYHFYCPCCQPIKQDLGGGSVACPVAKAVDIDLIGPTEITGIEEILQFEIFVGIFIKKFDIIIINMQTRRQV